LTRRAALRRLATTAATTAAAAAAVGAAWCAAPARAELVLGKPSTSQLLRRMDHEHRSDEEVAAERAARDEARAARRARQLQLQADADRQRDGVYDAKASAATAGSDIEANLRANYYFPTARKRYLPRVKRALEDLPRVKDAVAAAQWTAVADFVKEGSSLTDCGLPMRLYASSLSGQGLSLAAKFVQDMTSQADRVENALKALVLAVKKKDQATALTSLTEMEQSVRHHCENKKRQSTPSSRTKPMHTPSITPPRDCSSVAPCVVPLSPPIYISLSNLPFIPIRIRFSCPHSCFSMQIARFRAAGKLEGPDFGIGEVPKDAKVGSGLGNNK
jgi:hypothetical protein